MRSSDNKVFEIIADTESRRYIDTDIAIGQTYYYKLATIGTDSQGELQVLESSELIQAKTFSYPNNIKATENFTSDDGSAAGTIIVSWDAVEGIDSYRVYRNKVGGSPITVMPATTELRYVDFNAEFGTVHEYTVVTLKNAVSSIVSPPVQGVSIDPAKLLPPTTSITVKITKKGFDFLTVRDWTVSWSAVPNATSYFVYYKKEGASEWYGQKKVSSPTLTMKDGFGNGTGDNTFFKTVKRNEKVMFRVQSVSQDQGVDVGGMVKDILQTKNY